jgi:hypothetical protein
MILKRTEQAKHSLIHEDDASHPDMISTLPLMVTMQRYWVVVPVGISSNSRINCIFYSVIH